MSEFAPSPSIQELSAHAVSRMAPDELARFAASVAQRGYDTVGVEPFTVDDTLYVVAASEVTAPTPKTLPNTLVEEDAIVRQYRPSHPFKLHACVVGLDTTGTDQKTSLYMFERPFTPTPVTNQALLRPTVLRALMPDENSHFNPLRMNGPEGFAYTTIYPSAEDTGQQPGVPLFDRGPDRRIPLLAVGPESKLTVTDVEPAENGQRKITTALHGPVKVTLGPSEWATVEDGRVLALVHKRQTVAVDVPSDLQQYPTQFEFTEIPAGEGYRVAPENLFDRSGEIILHQPPTSGSNYPPNVQPHLQSEDLRALIPPDKLEWRDATDLVLDSLRHRLAYLIPLDPNTALQATLEAARQTIRDVFDQRAPGERPVFGTEGNPLAVTGWLGKLPGLIQGDRHRNVVDIDHFRPRRP